MFFSLERVIGVLQFAAAHGIINDLEMQQAVNKLNADSAFELLCIDYTQK